MGWEKRQRGGLYYVRKERIGKKVISHYIGGGKSAAAIAEVEIRNYQLAKLQREEERKLFADLDERNRQLAEYCEWVDSILIQTLEAAGYHRQNGGPWRKRRIKPSGNPANAESTIVQE